MCRRMKLLAGSCHAHEWLQMYTWGVHAWKAAAPSTGQRDERCRFRGYCNHGIHALAFRRCAAGDSLGWDLDGELSGAGWRLGLMPTTGWGQVRQRWGAAAGLALHARPCSHAHACRHGGSAPQCGAGLWICIPAGGGRSAVCTTHDWDTAPQRGSGVACVRHRRESDLAGYCAVVGGRSWSVTMTINELRDFVTVRAAVHARQPKRWRCNPHDGDAQPSMRSIT